MANILVLHGPNLNMLGLREPEIYGTTTLSQIKKNLELFAHTGGHKMANFQSNAEHELVEIIQSARIKKIDFIIINPAAFTYTSVSIRDALLAVAVPFIEVHLSNIFAREDFRKHSYFSDVAVAVIVGLGALGYELAVEGAEQYLDKIKKTKANGNQPVAVKKGKIKKDLRV